VHERVGHQFIPGGLSLPVRKRTYVDEDARSAAVRRDESEALIVFPVGNFPLIAHDDSPWV
jgi:hypothetical protein